ncbi:MAG: hypothetical protein IH851_03610 [Armatimonadetes bacterium]|nr:hypothetical protein [Armatimonadota bacterium]
MLAVLAVVSLALPAQTADYFPLKPGLEWEYRVAVGRFQAEFRQVHRILEAVEIEGKSVTPMEVLVNGEISGVTYYAVHDGFVHLMATEPDALLAVPVPVVPMEPKRGQKWEFKGPTPFLGSMARAVVKSRVAGFMKAKVIGEEMEVLKVVTESQLGEGKLSYKIRTTELYARGIGMVYTKKEVLRKNGGVAEFTLTRFKGDAP